MYLSYFGLAEAPFSIAPDPRYLYMSQRHQEALAHLLYGVNAGGGFVLLTGEVGAGKTTVCRCFLEQIPESCDVAYIFNPKLTVPELLSTICAEFGIDCPAGNSSVKVYIDCINAYLLAAHAKGRHTVLIIDEAQNLSPDVLEQLRLLTNLETNERKLLQIILLGQPELAEMVAQPELRQLAQRVIARFHLGPLGKHEVSAYVQHRLGVAGAQRNIFPDTLTGRLFQLSGGVPRIINVLCDRALLGAYTQNKEKVDRVTLKQAAHEVFDNPAAKPSSLLRPLLLGLLLATSVFVAVRYQATEQEITPKQNVAGKVLVPKPVVVVPEIPDTPTISDELVWPETIPVSQSEELAYAGLLKVWGTEYRRPEQGGGKLCQQAELAGLHCYVARGWLEDLRELDMPAILQMQDKQGERFDATLVGLDEESATFAIGEKIVTVSLAVFGVQWSGHYTLLWRKLPLMSKKMRPGDYGPDVAWLGKQLSMLEGKEDKPQGLLFDVPLMKQIKRFQLEHGLKPDGTVGPQTMMYLSSMLDEPGPRLLKAFVAE